MIDWTPYFESICEKYAQWWDVYTLTDVEGKIRQQKTAPWLMDLKVQTVERKWEETATQKEEEENQRKEEKIERLTVLDGLKKYAAENHVLLSGRPGSGKSTALVQLLSEKSVRAQDLRPENLSTITQVPILIELRYYQTSIFDLILQFLQRHELIIDEKTLENLLMGQATVLPLLLFDGINELPSGDARDELQRFREDYPKIPMIFTTRDLGIRGDLKIEKKLEMLPLNDSQMRDFVRAYLPEKGEQMLRQLGDRLREFGQTPLLLMMLCSVFESNESQIPANLGSVFRLFTEGFDIRKREEEGVNVSDTLRRWQKRLLQHLAWEMTAGEKPTEVTLLISREKAEDILIAFLQGKVSSPEDCALEWLEDLLKYYLIQVTSDKRSIEFCHQLIQEYYAAEALLKKLPDLRDEELRWDYLNYLKWTETIALMLGMENSEEQARRVVKLGLEIDLKLGARLAGEVRVEFQRQTVGLVLGLDVRKRFKVDLLGITKSDEVVNELNRALEDSDKYVRRNAVSALRKIGTEAVINGLLQALEDSDDGIRRSAVFALGKIGTEAAISGLFKALEDSDKDIRKQAAETLGKLGSESAILRLLQTLADFDEDVRSAARALAAIPKLFPTLEQSSESAILRLLQALEDFDEDVRRSLAQALAAIPKLFPTLEQSDEDISRYADSSIHQNTTISLLNDIGGGTVAVPTLINYLNDSSEDLSFRRGIILTLAEISSETTVKPFIPTIVESLIPLLEESDYWVRLNAAEALGKFGSEAAIHKLLQVLGSDRDIRGNAAAALGNIGSEVAISGLLQALEDSNEYVCLNAAEALGKIGSETTLTVLLNALKSPNFVTANNGNTFYQAYSAISTIQDKLKYYRPQPMNQQVDNTPTQQTQSQTIIQNFHEKVYGVAANVQGNLQINPDSATTEIDKTPNP